MPENPEVHDRLTRRRPAWLLLVLVLALIATACGGDAEDDTTAAPEADTATADDGAAEPDADTGESDPAAEASEGGDAAQGDVEGTVVYYSTRPEDGLAPLEEAFEADNPGIDLQVIRGSSSDIVSRVLTESQAGQQLADVTEMNSLPIAELADAGVLDVLPEGITEGLPEQAVSPEGLYAGTRYFGHLIPYNTDLVPEENIPTSHESFLDPFWEGNFLVGANDVEWAYQIFEARGEEDGRAFLEAIAAQNPQIRDEGRGAIAELVAGGQVLAADMTLDYHVFNREEEGLPIGGGEWDPPLLNIDWLAVFADRPNPEATDVFLEWLYSEDGVATDAELGFNRIGDDGTEDALSDPDTVILTPATAELQRAAAEAFGEIFPVL